MHYDSIRLHNILQVRKRSKTTTINLLCNQSSEMARTDRPLIIVMYTCAITPAAILSILQLGDNIGSLEHLVLQSAEQRWPGEVSHPVQWISWHIIKWKRHETLNLWGLTMVDLGADKVLLPLHMPMIRWLSASIAWMRASREPVRGWIGLQVLLVLANTQQQTVLQNTVQKCRSEKKQLQATE